MSLKNITIIGFLILCFFQLIFVGIAAYEKFSMYVIFGYFILIIGAALLGYAQLRKNIDIQSIGKKDYHLFLACIVGASLTYVLNIYVGLGPVIGAGIVGTVASFLPLLKQQKISDLPVPLYCGAFVGMSSALILPNIRISILAGTICGILFVICKNVFNGVGGKLGTIAFGSVCITVFITYLVSLL